jgi:epoxyqueuosine reductase QueG
MDRGAFQVVKLLEDRGYIGLPTVASGVEDLKNIMAAFSQRHAAVAAGLGEFGWNGVALVPDVGPRVRFVSIITTAPLDPDPMYSGPSLCKPDACRKLGGGVQLCVRVCPIQVMSPDRTMTAVIGERKFEYGWKDYMMCGKTVGVGLHPLVLGPENMVIPEKIDWETSMQLRSKMPAKESLETLTYARGHFCGLCILRCPVGRSAAVDKIMKGKEVTYR